mmetsp:Transcript_19214/g.50979  ORF Transcript_19214/g.50979 Transcript_19214/m.50979 type:complete len:222 (+) Transcript_19214:3-668(+)
MPPAPAALAPYIAQFDAAAATAARKLTGARLPSTPAAESLALITDAEDAVADAAAVLQSLQLDAAAREASRADPAGALPRMKKELEKIRADVRSAKGAADTARGAGDRNALFLGHGGRADRAELMRDAELLEKSGARIAESERMVGETETMGIGILEDLAEQRRTIQRARETVVQMDEGVNQSEGFIAQMKRRNQVNKMIMYGVAGVTVLAVLLILFMRFR